MRRKPALLALPVLAVVAVAGWFMFSGRNSTDAGADSSNPAPRAGNEDLFDQPADIDPGSLPVAGSPEEAATAFLTAEAAGDFESSYAYLSADDRNEYGPPAGWFEAHAELWEVTDFAGVAKEDDSTVIADVRLRPMLDEFAGLVPAEARLHLPMVEEDGAWRVSFRASEYEASYPDDDTADDAVLAWAEAKRACADAPEWDGGLVGAADLGDALCRTDRAVDVGRPDTIDTLLDATPFLNTFGSAVGDWARVVRVHAETEFDAVVAPLDDRWVVIGLMPTSFS